jgi:diguanylate cyclase (GGDEF)-like protein
LVLRPSLGHERKTYSEALKFRRDLAIWTVMDIRTGPTGEHGAQPWRAPEELALVAFALTALGLGIGMLRERRRSREAERKALTDALTGLANRIAFDHQLAIDWERATRYDRPLGMLLLDLDGFKQVNDTQGHAAGDRVLRRVADTITANVRGGDVAARLGGDEFVVLTTETPAEGLQALAGRLQQAVESLGTAISVGWAEREPDDESPSKVLDRADLAMYEDKERGRASPRPARTPAGL